MGRQLTVTLPDDVADAVDRAVAEQGWRDADEYIANVLQNWREPFTEPFTPEEEEWMIKAAEEAEADAAVNGYLTLDEVMKGVHELIDERARAYAASVK